MALAPDTTTGTITLTSGSAAFTTVGTNMQTRGHLAGDMILRNNLVAIIDTITGENTGTLTEVASAGIAGAGVAVRIRFQPDGSRVSAQTRAMIDLFGNGNLSAEADLTGAADQVSYYTGPGAKALTGLTAAARTVLDDTTVAAMLATLLNSTLGVTDNRLLRSDGTAGGAAQNSPITVSDAGNMSGVVDLTATGNVTGASLIVSGAGSFVAGSLFSNSNYGMAVTAKQASPGLAEHAWLNSAGTLLASILPTSNALNLPFGQLAFPAAQNPSAGANVQDDYEEGTYTPVYSGTTTAGAGTYSLQGGSYTKVGNRVLHTNSLVWSAHTGTGNGLFGGLPFTSKNDGNLTSISIITINLTASGPPIGYIEANSVTIALYAFVTNSVSAIAIDTAASAYISGQYAAVA